MALEQEFRTFYTTNPVVTRLNFGLPGLQAVTPAGFRVLASCIVGYDEPNASTGLRRSMRIRTNAAFIENGNLAEYWFRGNDRVPPDTMLLSSPDIFNSVFGRAVAYHESVHALLDAYGGNINRRDNEGSAFLGEALFHLECGYNATNLPPGLTGDQTANYGMLNGIFPIAQAMKARAGGGGGTMMATAAEVQQLRAIMAGFRIAGNITSLNGIRGRRIVNGAWN